MRHRIISALTAAVAFCGSLGAFPSVLQNSYSASAQVFGDADCDLCLTVADLTLINQSIHRNSVLDFSQYTGADANCDEIVNVTDALIAKRNLLWRDYYMNLVINEVCSSNKTSYADSTGASPDWVEIYNPNEISLDLSGIGLSDGTKNKYKLAFPKNSIIPANGYVIVCCDNALVSVEGEYHANFKISASGETIYLTHPLYGQIDSVDVPELETDVCFGRYANGSDNFSYLTPTPGSDNNSAEDLKLVEKPVFSSDGGFYDADFTLELSDISGNEIYYTLDGSDPTTSSTAKLYTSGISIYNNTSNANVYSALTDITLYDTYRAPSSNVDKGIVVRAVSKSADGKYSKVVTNSYFVNKTASYYSDFKVISISTDPCNFFDSDNGIYMVGSGYYQWKNSSQYVKYDDGSIANPTNYNKKGKDTEIPVNIQVFEKGSLAYTADVGARIAGNWSRANPQKSIRLYARSQYGTSKMKYEFIDNLTDEYGNTIDEYDKITLRNGGTDNLYSHLRDALIQDLCKGTNVALQGAQPCIVFIDGEFWGFYFIRERLESDYIESHYSVDKDNVTTIKNGELDEGSTETAAEYEEFLNWAATADMSLDENYEKVCDVIDIDSFADYIAIETYINNADWLTDYLNNLMMWRATEVDASNEYADGKWRFMLFDTEFSTNIFGNSTTSPGYDSLGSMYTKQGGYNFAPMFYNLLNNEEFAEKFYNNYTDIMNNNFAPDEVTQLIDEYSSRYKEAITATGSRFYMTYSPISYGGFDTEITSIKNFFIYRRNNAKLYLDRLCDKAPEITVGTNLAGTVSGWTYYGSGSASKSSADNSFTMTTYSSSANSWDIQSQSQGFTLTKGKSYRISFKASCSTGVPLSVCINHNENGSYPNAFSKSGIELTSQLQTFTYDFVSTGNTASDWKFCVNYGDGAGKYVIADLTICELNYNFELVGSVGKWYHYSPNNNSIMTVDSPNSVTIQTVTLPDEGWQNQALFCKMVLESGKTYQIKFTIKADKAANVKVSLQQNYGDYSKFLDKTVNVGTSEQTYTYNVTLSQDCIDASLCFSCGYSAATYTITDVSVSYAN